MLSHALDVLGIPVEVKAVGIESMPNAHLRPRKSDLDVSKIVAATGLDVNFVQDKDPNPI